MQRSHYLNHQVDYTVLRSAFKHTIGRNIVTVGSMVYSGAMTLPTNHGHNNRSGEVERGLALLDLQ